MTVNEVRKPRGRRYDREKALDRVRVVTEQWRRPMATAIVKDGGYSREQVELLKRTLAPRAKLTDDEMGMFIEVCKRTGLDPFRRQIYAVKRRDNKLGMDVVTHQTSIDGFRTIAVRSGKYEGTLGPFWCAQDGKWVDAWLSREKPFAARVGIHRAGCKEPIWAVARYEAYSQPTQFWDRMGDNMIAKCAEALALRKAFPEDDSSGLSGLYTEDEMEQADAPVIPELAEHSPLGMLGVERSTGEVKVEHKRATAGLSEEKAADPVEVDVVKANNGPTGRVRLVFDERSTRFFNLPEGT